MKLLPIIYWELEHTRENFMRLEIRCVRLQVRS
jgi:hypothetical protein